jgi:hypothetical protein
MTEGIIDITPPTPEARRLSAKTLELAAIFGPGAGP